MSHGRIVLFDIDLRNAWHPHVRLVDAQTTHSWWNSLTRYLHEQLSFTYLGD